MTRSGKKLVLIVVDGLTPSVFEAAETPALRFLLEHGTYRRAVSTFPSLTPVCVSSIVTGAHGDVHEIPHLVWWHRGERRLVEYGSSFAAVRAAGVTQSLRDTIFNLNRRHLGAGATTVYEALEDAGLAAAAINITCYRGRTRHLPIIPGLPAAYGPKHFFFYTLFQSARTGAPIAVRNRAAGSIDTYAASVGRWLVTRDSFDFLVYYLADYDYASHALGPGSAGDALVLADNAVAALMDAAGGWDEFLDRYDVLLCSDHGQTRVDQLARLTVDGGRVTASNRAAMVYGENPRALAAQVERQPGVDVVAFLEGGEVIARRGGEQGPELLDEYPQGRERVEAALRNPNSGEVLVSAADGWEFADLAGGHHLGGGSHGSLAEQDSVVPMLGIGVDPPASITGVKGAVLSHFGVELARVA